MAMSAVRWPYPVLASWLEQQNINETSTRSAKITAPTLPKMQTTGVMSHTVRAFVVSLANLLVCEVCTPSFGFIDPLAFACAYTAGQ